MELDQHPVRLCGHHNMYMQQRKPGTGGFQVRQVVPSRHKVFQEQYQFPLAMLQYRHQ